MGVVGATNSRPHGPRHTAVQFATTNKRHDSTSTGCKGPTPHTHAAPHTHVQSTDAGSTSPCLAFGFRSPHASVTCGRPTCCTRQQPQPNLQPRCGSQPTALGMPGTPAAATCSVVGEEPSSQSQPHACGTRSRCVWRGQQQQQLQEGAPLKGTTHHAHTTPALAGSSASTGGSACPTSSHRDVSGGSALGAPHNQTPGACSSSSRPARATVGTSGARPGGLVPKRRPGPPCSSTTRPSGRGWMLSAGALPAAGGSVKQHTGS